MKTPTIQPRSRMLIAQLFAVSLLIFISRNPTWMAENVRIVPPISDCLLSPEHVWQVPLSKSDLSQLVSSIPYLLYAFLAATLLTNLVLLNRRIPVWAAFLVIGGLSAVMQPLDLLPVLLLWGSIHIIDSEWLNARRLLQVTLLSILAFVVLLTTLEFGFLLFILLMMSYSTPKKPNQLTVILVAITLCGVLILGSVNTGFFSTLMRPFLWCYFKAPVELIPRLGSPLLIREYWASIAIFVATGMMLRPYQRSSLIKDEAIRIFIVLFMSLIVVLLGLLTVHYLFLATASLVLLSRNSRYRFEAFPHQTRTIVFAIIILLGYASYKTDKIALLAGEAPERIVDVANWDLPGNVLLMDLSRSHDWQTERLSDSYRLILDDRWEVFGPDYSRYLDVCRDLKNVYPNAYLKSDLTWGGYRHLIGEWQATLVVIPSTQLQGIRNLSNSTEWKVLGIDSVRTIFGTQDVIEYLPHLQRAFHTMMRLEWPRPGENLDISSVLVANTDPDAQVVAEVLCCTRLPYAGLRFIRNDYSLPAEKVRTRCYLELAHRVARHSGTGSLLDQYRAVASLRNQLNADLWSQQGVSRFQKSLRALGVQVSETDQEGTSSGEDVDTKKNSNTLSHGGRNQTQGISQNENWLKFRAAMLQGDVKKSQKISLSLDSNLRPIAKVLSQSATQSAEETLISLQAANQMSDLPDHIAGEIIFYIGCLQLEVGETSAALQSFSESLNRQPDLEYHAIRTLYIQQLK